MIQVGNPTILINNAGTVQGKYFTELTPDQIKRTIEVNLYGSMWLTKTFLPDMIKVNKGHVLSVSSAAGLVGLAWLTDYCASKFALYGFMESLRQELRHTNIHTTVLCPAHLTTRLFANVHPPYQFITPSLDATYVATKMINALEGKKSRDIWIPLATWAALIVRLSPVWLNDWAHKVMKTNEYKPESEGPFYARPDFMKKKQC
ncbi:hypothetical protein BKA69DRAFT_1076324 [Paraphysoderma sedebokerense]|nr:hypothetical protein BKA69DRAFT_1076324 [Paraphysoderma sedebokerense]